MRSARERSAVALSAAARGLRLPARSKRAAMLGVTARGTSAGVRLGDAPNFAAAAAGPDTCVQRQCQ